MLLVCNLVTMKLLFALVLVFSLGACISGTKETRHRQKRQIFHFNIISNQSVPCTQLASEYNTTVTELSGQQKDQLFKLIGGSMDNNYLASTPEEALEKFPNLLTLSEKYSEKILESRGTKTGLLTTQDVIKYMDDTLYPETQTGRRRHQLRTYRQLLASLEGVDSVGERLRSWKQWIKQVNPDITEDVLNFPFHSAEMLGRKNEVTPDGETSQRINYCHAKGDPTSDGKHLLFCATCSATNMMTGVEDYWPPYINTAMCDPLDRTCIMESGVAHGTCHQLLYPIKMMKKNSDSMCVVVLDSGETLVSYEWLIVDEYFDLGCSCNVFEDSVFAQFAQ